MTIFAKPFEEIRIGDIQSLVDNRATESRQLEFKSQLPGRTDGEIRDFLADASSFANRDGGIIVYGIREEDGEAAEIIGISGSVPDDEKLRLNSTLLSNLSPRISGLKIRTIPIQSAHYLLLILVPRSWQMPHMVDHKGLTRFHSRNSGGKYRMDATEIRRAFQESQLLSNRIRTFHQERVKAIANGTSLLGPINERAFIALHLIPLISFQDPASTLIADPKKHDDHLIPMRGGISASRYNLDGYATSSHGSDGEVDSYVQLFRNGIFETADTSLLKKDPGGPIIPSAIFEPELLVSLENCVKIYQSESIEPPYYAFLALNNVRGYTIAFDYPEMGPRSLERIYNKGIDRDNLVIPELEIQSLSGEDLPLVMKPLLDVVWNAAGWPRSYSFDKDGKFIYDF